MKGSTEVVIVQIPGAKGYMMGEDAQTRPSVRMGRVDAIDNVRDMHGRTNARRRCDAMQKLG